MWLIIIFILGTLCVIFNEKIGEFFSKIIDLDLIFLSKKEKKIKQQQQAFLKDFPEKLCPVYEFILQKYAHTSGKRCWNEQIEKCLSILPETISDFFEKYDYLSVDKQKIVNIKSLKIIDVNNNRYAIIGKDPDSHDLFIVNLEKNTSQDYMIYQISDEQHILSEIKDENSLEHLSTLFAS
ncbi:MAG: hypothetical protein IKA22_01890 [Lentisphaeria bacterium]|nr:hypothetical protein [Lentisphaeria bacterium]